MKFIILGCGSSMGVPKPDGSFGICNPNNVKNYRSRCSAILLTKKENILIDTSPDLRFQLIKNKIKKINKVIYSHMHADQTHGINDLRIFFLKGNKPISIYADKPTRKYLLDNFSYCFNSFNKEYPAMLKMYSLKKKIFIKDNKNFIRSIEVRHGKIKSICYLIDKKIAYLSDVSQIFERDHKFFKNIKYLVIDCLRYKEHPSHFNLKQCIDLTRLFSPKKTILTNLNTDLDYDVLRRELPSNIIPAYDGLTLNL